MDDDDLLITEAEHIASQRWYTSDPLRRKFTRVLILVAAVTVAAILGDMFALWVVAELSAFFGFMLLFCVALLGLRGISHER